MRYLVTNIQWGRRENGKEPPPIRRREVVRVDCADEIPEYLERAHGARVLSCEMQPLPEVEPIVRREILQQAIAKATSSTKLAGILVREPRHVRRMLAGEVHISDAVLAKCQEVIDG